MNQQLKFIVKSCAISSILIITGLIIGYINEIKIVSSNHRMQLFKNTLAMIIDHPFGVGIGQFEFSLIPYYGFRHAFIDRNPHNEFLKWIAENGIPFIVIFFIISFIFLRKSEFKVFNFFICNMSNEQKKEKLILFTTFILALLLQCLFQFPFENPCSVFLVSMVVGFFLSDIASEVRFQIKTTAFFRMIGILPIFLSFSMGFSIWMASYSQDLSLKKIACVIDSVNWRNCKDVVQILTENGNTEEAVAILKSELKIRPLNFLFLLNLSEIYLFQKDFLNGCNVGKLYYQLFPHQIESQKILDLCKEYEFDSSNKFDPKNYFSKLEYLLVSKEDPKKTPANSIGF
jgi:hypothetical protein